MKNNLPKRLFKKAKSVPKTDVSKAKQPQFPSISQTIPESLWLSSFFSPIFLTAFACGFLFMAIVIIGSDLKNNLYRYNLVNQERAIIKAQIVEWKGALSRYKNYKDGYYVLSLLEYRLGNNEKAYEYASKALAIDPNYKEAKELLVRIAGK